MNKEKEERLLQKIKRLELEVMDLQAKLKEAEALAEAECLARDAAEDELDRIRGRMR